MELVSEHNYRPYSEPKRALYYQTGQKYVQNPITGLWGWEQIEIETNVIGEDDLWYIEKIRLIQIHDLNDPNYGKEVLYPFGFHKSRLVKWLPTPAVQSLVIGSPYQKFN